MTSIPVHILAQIQEAIEELPVITKEDIDASGQDSCPICLTDFESLLASEHTDPDRLSGATKVPTCNHVFCRQDLAEWIKGLHGSCPTCRHPFVDLDPLPDDESSDGGEYIPADDLDNDDELFDDSFLTSEPDFEQDEDVDFDLERYLEEGRTQASEMEDWSEDELEVEPLSEPEDGSSSSIEDMDQVLNVIQVDVSMTEWSSQSEEAQDQDMSSSDEEPK
ncbi:hypothetical protein DL96DRAFT_1707602 [Flagelloscypha sp. PMI_526]|nr:hypothetical protein DL96DRAFT_1707602 [Flagelloscypha sp. PMI_526]